MFEAYWSTLAKEADALTKLSRSIDRPMMDKVLGLLSAHRDDLICVTGMGKSGHVARKVASTMTSLGARAVFVHPAEAAHGDLGLVDKLVIAFSWSGDTIELRPIIDYAPALIGVTSRADSALGRAAHGLVLLPRLAEACVNGQAPTVSTTMQLAVGDALAVALSSEIGFTADMFRSRHPGGALGATK